MRDSHPVQASFVPADVLEAAHTHLEDNQTRNRKTTEELLRILDRLDRAGIPAIPFKGPALAENYYGDPCLRRYSDLDFLIAKDAAVETVEILRSLKYGGSGQVSSKDKDFVLSPRQIAALCHYAGEYLFFHKENPIAIEPHWTFVPPTLGLDLDYKTLWSRTRRSVLSGNTILGLSQEDTLLSLALHGAKSNWGRLQWVSDFDRVVKSEIEIDWEALLDEARQAGILRILLVGLQLVRTLFATEIVEHASVAIEKDRVAQVISAEQTATLFSVRTSNFSTFTISRYWIRMLDRPIAKIRYVFRTVFIPRVQHFEMLSLPDNLFYAYYALKPKHDYIALPLWPAAKKSSLLKRTF